jgi:deoxyribodipyrimidine photo-lyase
MRFVHWFRNDLRLRDNTALSAAAARGQELIPVFVFDPRLCDLQRAGTPRLRFLLDCVAHLARDLERRGSRLVIRRGDPAAEIPSLLRDVRASGLTFNRDYTPYARRRDAAVSAIARGAGVQVEDYKDRVLFESEDVRNRSGGPFLVYTPYRRAWRARLDIEAPTTKRIPRLPAFPRNLDTGTLPSAEDLGIAEDNTRIPAAAHSVALRRLRDFLDRRVCDYAVARDFPAVEGTSRLSPYLRFGLLSVRQCVEEALRRAREPVEVAGAHRWLDELTWREFYYAILAEEPRVLREPWKRQYEAVAWDENPSAFEAWCEGRTGYPFVDAAMRQLAQTGWMHNRARMVVGSFLVKDLLIDWRFGEAFFMQHLIDGDPAVNNGGWQWVASTGTDAQPYFRIFNPIAQGERFDPQGRYVRRYVPELCRIADRFVHRPWEAPTPPRAYPPPMVDHDRQRRVAIERFRLARQRGGKT